MKYEATVLKRYLTPVLAQQAAEGKWSPEQELIALGQLEEIHKVMRTYLPQGASVSQSLLQKGVKNDRTILLVDVSGFTILSERLSRIGKEGGRRGDLHHQTAIFSPIIKNSAELRGRHHLLRG